MPHVSLWDLFEKSFSDHKHKKSIEFYRADQKETVLTYQQLLDDVLSFSRFLNRYNVKEKDRVILLLDKSVMSIIAHLSLIRRGLVSVPLNPGFKKSELTYLIKDCDPALIITEPEQQGVLQSINRNIPVLEVSTRAPYQDLDFFKSEQGRNQGIGDTKISVETEPSDPALIIYTSGTTGDPKGAVLSCGNLINDAQNIIRIWELSPDDTLCHALPLFHVHGLCFALHTMFLTGGRIVLQDFFKAEVILNRLKTKTDPCSVFMAVPTMYNRLINQIGERKFDFSHLRLLTSGSAPLLEKEFVRIEKTFGKPPVEREGMTETGMNFSNPLHAKKIAGSIGIPLPKVQVRVVDPETQRDVEPGQIGEFWLKSASIISAYWNKPEQTKQTFSEGWFKTGDLGRQDESGYYYLTDRIKHLIITGGENVSAKEVERVIDAIKGVEMSCVVGIADEEWGEKVVAAVQLEKDEFVTQSDILTSCKKNLNNYKCPKKVLFCDKIPKNTMGKVLKEQVKSMFLENKQC